MARQLIGVLLLLALPVSIIAGETTGRGEVGGLIALSAILMGIVWVPGFLRSILRGAIAGGIAGVLVLGPGMRLAMRIVALMEPARPTEFTIGGTLFIIMFIGGIVGALVGAHARVTADSIGWHRGGAQLLAFAVVSVLLFSDSEIRSELVDLGAGPFVNLALFVLVFGGYAEIFDRLSRWRRPSEQTLDSVAVGVA